MNTLLIERPISTGFAGGTLNLLDHAAETLQQKESLEHSLTFGIFGARGAGKTSFLLGLLEKLRRRTTDNKHLVLPMRENSPRPGRIPFEDALFSPSRHRVEDDLLFLLIDFLCCRYEFKQSGVEAVRQQLEELEVKRLELSRFLDYEQSVSPTVKDIPRRLREVRREAATTTTALYSAFGKLLDLLRTPKKEVIILPVDDLDLQPQRALELLELLHLFLSHPGVYVLLTADMSLMLQHLRSALVTRRWPQGDNPSVLEQALDPELPGALLAKYVPYRWELPLPGVEERLRYLSLESGTDPSAKALPEKQPTQEQREETPELDWWWDKTLDETLQAFLRILPDRSLQERVDRFKRLSSPDGMPVRSAFLSQLLPPTWRQLKAILNRLYLFRKELLKQRRETELKIAVASSFGEATTLGPQVTSAFVLILLVLDVCMPEVRLVDCMRRMGPLFPLWLQKLEGLDQGAEARSKQALPWREDGYLDEQKRQFADLALLWRRLKQVQTSNILAAYRLDISLNRDVFADAQQANLLQASGLSDNALRDWHINLIDALKISSGARCRPEQLRAAQTTLRQRLQERKLLQTPGEKILNMKMQLPLCIWLGWYTRYTGEGGIGAYNLTERNYVYFPPIIERLKSHEDLEERDLVASETSLGWRLREPVPGGDPRQAVVLLDLQAKAPAQPRTLWSLLPFGGQPFQALTADGSLSREVDAFGAEPSEGTAANGSGRSEDLPGLLVILGTTQRFALSPENSVQSLQSVIDGLTLLRRSYGITTFHLLLSCPDVFAFFLGQQLNALGTVKLYEHYTEGRERYEYVFDLAELA